jgi:hypothetical protein
MPEILLRAWWRVFKRKSHIWSKCGGEIKYFKAIAGPNTEVNALGFGTSKTALVKKVFKYCQHTNIYVSDTEVWVVFDFDVHYSQLKNQKQDFNNAVKRARVFGYNVAYSNDCFELFLPNRQQKGQ